MPVVFVYITLFGSQAIVCSFYCKYFLFLEYVLGKCAMENKLLGFNNSLKISLKKLTLRLDIEYTIVYAKLSLKVDISLILDIFFYLVNDINAILELLSLQKWVQVVQQKLEVMFSVSVGDDNSCSVPGLTVRWPVASATHHQRILSLNLF